MPNSDHEIIITSNAQKKLYSYIQKSNQPEKGGLLFARIQLPEVRIQELSTPNKTDKMGLFIFEPDQKKQQKKINSLFRKNLHFVGEWHTHPQRRPLPSKVDINTMGKSFIKSQHELNYFIMIILGNVFSKDWIWMGLHNEFEYIELEKT